MKFLSLMFLVLACSASEASALEKPPITMERPIIKQGGPWYAIVLGRMKKSGRISGAMSAYEPTKEIASEKALKSCLSRTDMAECNLIVASKECLFVSVGTKDRGKEVKYIYASTAEESLRKCSVGGFLCWIQFVQGCKQ